MSSTWSIALFLQFAELKTARLYTMHLLIINISKQKTCMYATLFINLQQKLMLLIVLISSPEIVIYRLHVRICIQIKTTKLKEIKGLMWKSNISKNFYSNESNFSFKNYYTILKKAFNTLRKLKQQNIQRENVDILLNHTDTSTVQTVS